MGKLGLYVHVPFCGRSCDFCSFYQEAPDRSRVDAYLGWIEKELSSLKPHSSISTVFIGGGTPGLLKAGDLERLAIAIRKVTGGTAEEWTVEMAPATVKKDKLSIMKDLGVTRISMGVQSFQKSLLESLGRIHSLDQVYIAIDLIKDSGISNLNLDLMFAIPGQTKSDWLKDLEEAVSHEPQHLSTYCLTFEEDTALYVKLSKGQIQAMKEEDERDLYLSTWEFLSANGYPQYEVSNFARSGYECQHNINTWEMSDWLAAGPSASGQYKNYRYTRVHSLEEWGKGVDQGSPANIENQFLDGRILASDALVFGLRMNKGVFLPKWYSQLENVDRLRLDCKLGQLAEEGLLRRSGDMLALTTEGRLLADSIGSDIMAVLE